MPTSPPSRTSWPTAEQAACRRAPRNRRRRADGRRPHMAAAANRPFSRRCPGRPVHQPPVVRRSARAACAGRRGDPAVART
ncbi:MAG: hypothetical protein ACK559_02350 [bacterium]